MVSFADKFIAFVDVLGSKKLVSEAEQGEGLPLPDLLKLLGCLGTGKERDRFEKYGPTCCPCAPRIEKNLDFRVTQISDCVVVSAELSPAGVINVVSHCWGAVIELLQHGIMCRGYIKRGSVYHTDTQIIGSGYQEAFLAEPKVSAFRREADERGTPYVEIDPAVTAYVDTQSDACVKEMFSRMVKRDGDTVALFPFQRLAHSFIVAGHGHRFDPGKERRSNQNLRALIHQMKGRVQSIVDPSNPSAAAKAEHYIAALDAQLAVCDKTDEVINILEAPFPHRRDR
jgi:hypothetical protein